jgi:MraZ protein
LFQGEYEHSVDDKGRVIMPSKIRSLLGERFVMCKGFDGCVYIYSESGFQAICEQLKSTSTLSEHSIRVQRRLMASFEVGTDTQGRVAIPQKLRQFADIGDQGNVAILGMVDHVEIWNVAAWEKYNNELTDEMVRESAKEVGMA